MNSLRDFIILSVQNQSPFTVYNASAGSGKTFTLVKDYLKILFVSKSKLAFRHILALTFTNKAVGEMKARIIDMLKLFSEEEHLPNPHPMFKELMSELNVDPKTLQLKSKSLLQTIVHNYAAFDISTIDKFNHKLIRTFAFDLKLPLNFEVELETDLVLSQAVDKLIDKAGSAPELTKVLIDFAIEKTDDDKSWNIAYDFNQIAKLLVSENDMTYVMQLKDKNLEDFKALRSQFSKEHNELTNQIVGVADGVLALIQDSNLDHNDFSGGYLPKHLIKLATKNFDVSFATNWQDQLIDGTAIYPKRVSSEVATTIETIRSRLIEAFNKTKQAVYQVKFIENALKSITPLSVLSAIIQTLEEIKKEEDIVLISEFNAIINNEIKNQPAPFIYERIGEKFKHYYIDEFQDTSQLQWENLIPLICNAVSVEHSNNDSGTAMLVGDAKQAIYRWRGGRAEQFIDLYSGANPCHVEKSVENLPSNYRSHKTIVEFNNAFFKHISEFAFSEPKHQGIYSNSSQDVIIDKSGFIEFTFLNLGDKEKDALHCESVLKTIANAQNQGFSFKDICIIVRRKKEGVAIAEYLTNNDIPVISSESLLIKNAPEVQFINHIVALSTQPANDEVKIELLNYIAEEKLHLTDKHSFFSELVHLKAHELFEALESFGFEFDFNAFLQLPMYDAIESVVRGFQLNQAPNAYLQFYLDEVFDYSQRHHASYIGFLNYWEGIQDKLSIVSPLEKEAVQIMTIHKSKGLEFPVVIFPYANQDIYFDKSSKVWFPVDPKLFQGFSYLYLSINKDLKALNDQGEILYNEHRAQLELDSLNLLYVVMTRAIEQLYIISEFNPDKKQKSDEIRYYSELFIDYLKSTGQWSDEQQVYRFGATGRTSASKSYGNETIHQKEMISTPKEVHQLNIITNSGYLWDTHQERAIERGNLVHHIMSKIRTKNDIDFAISHVVDSGQIPLEQSESLRSEITKLVEHEQLSAYFSSDLKIFNEQDIISKDGKLLRPDRIVVNPNNQAVIIDYKTGLENSKYKEQLFDYQYVLEQMNFTVIKKILIYINDDILIKEF